MGAQTLPYRARTVRVRPPPDDRVYRPAVRPPHPGRGQVVPAVRSGSRRPGSALGARFAGRPGRGSLPSKQAAVASRPSTHSPRRGRAAVHGDFGPSPSHQRRDVTAHPVHGDDVGDGSRWSGVVVRCRAHRGRSCPSTVAALPSATALGSGPARTPARPSRGPRCSISSQCRLDLSTPKRTARSTAERPPWVAEAVGAEATVPNRPG